MEKPAANDDLNERIQGWRKTLLGRPGIGESDVDELESHLRDTVDRLTAAALTQEEAFLVAAHRIGSPVELEDQYSAVNFGEAWKTRVIWMVAGVLGYWTVTGASEALAKLTLIVGAGRVSDGVALARWGVPIDLVAIVAFGCLLFKCVRWQIIRNRKAGQTKVRNGSVGLIIWLALASLAASAAKGFVEVLAARLQGPATLGGYFLFSSYFLGPLSYLVVVGFGVWFARRKSGQLRQAGGILCLLLLFTNTGCSPNTQSNSQASAVVSTNAPTAAEQTATSAPAGSKTAFEQCMATVSANPDGAVDTFMKLDVSSEALFSFGAPLSYSEAQFAGLSQPVRDKIAEPMMQDITQVKRLIGAVKDRRDQARAKYDTKTADHYSKQLAALGTRLQGGENLKLTQLVGASASKIAAQ